LNLPNVSGGCAHGPKFANSAVLCYSHQILKKDMQMENRFAIPVSVSKFSISILAGVGIFAATSTLASTLDPNNFVSLGALGGGSVAIDTSSLTVDGSAGGVLVSQGAGLPDIAVFTFDGGSTLGDVVVSGLNAIAILFQGSATVSGTIDLSGNGRIGVAGGGNGGLGGTSAANGDGPGGGLGGSSSASTLGIGGGSGGGFGSSGESGGAGPTLRQGGVAYGDPLIDALQAGSGGGGGGWGNTRRGGSGGAGGGALEIGALTSLLFDGATILANGGNGETNFAGGGGGSGGGLLFSAYNIAISGNSLITANGGNGGSFGAAGNQGGCGGAGRIHMLYNTAGSFSNLGTVQATSGTGSPFCDQVANIFTVSTDSAVGMPPVSQVPVPAGLPLLATVMGVFGILGWRKKRTA
jgi:hypothetical protein